MRHLLTLPLSGPGLACGWVLDLPQYQQSPAGAMVVFSSLFAQPLNRINCAQLLHAAPGQSCCQSLLWSLFRNHVGSSRYYLPVLLAPLLLQCTQLNRRRVLQTLRHYAQTTSFAATINALALFFTCAARHCQGRFIWQLTPFVPTWLSAQLSWWLPQSVLDFYMLGVTQSTLQCLLQRLHPGVGHSRGTQTLVFMLCSLIILQHKHVGQYKGFWFIDAVTHTLSTTKRAYLGSFVRDLKKYFGMGLTLDVLSALSQPLRISPYAKLRRLRFKSSGFLLAYLSLYRLIFLLGPQRSFAHPLAACLAGSAFYMLNELSCMTLAMVIAVQVLWQQFCKRQPVNGWLKRLQSLPVARLLLPLEIAFLVHSFYFNHHSINALAKGFVNATSDNNTQRIYDFLIKNDAQSILEKLAKRANRGFLK